MGVMYLILSVLAVFIILCISEYGWRKHWLNNEIGRKFVHISVGTFVAFWPFFLSWNEIRLLSIAFLVVVLASNYLKLFHAINSVQRPTFGEVCFAASVGLLTLITHSKGIYAAAILQMSLADGFAAIVGTRFGRDNKYHLLGHIKSVAGTSAFIVTSLAILIGYSRLSVAGLSAEAIVGGAVIAAMLENIAALGIDNLLVPLFIGILLTRV
jgi:phytol kinase